MKYLFTVFVAVVLILIGLSIQPEVIPCDTDTDCAIKNPQFCGGPYEPIC